MDRLLLFTTAIVGLISLAATMVVQYETQQRFQRIEIEMDNIRVNVDRAATEAREAMAEAEQAGVPIDDGTIDAILALQDRLVEARGRRGVIRAAGAELSSPASSRRSPPASKAPRTTASLSAPAS